MFNGTITSVPQAFTVITPQLNSTASRNSSSSTTAPKTAPPPPPPQTTSVLQSLPCQLLGQTSLVLTPVANGSTVTCAPLALSVASQVRSIIHTIVQWFSTLVGSWTSFMIDTEDPRHLPNQGLGCNTEKKNVSRFELLSKLMPVLELQNINAASSEFKCSEMVTKQIFLYNIFKKKCNKQN